MAEAALSIAPVTDADLAAVDAYLAARSDTCMFLRSNLRDAGLSWTEPDGSPLQAQYVVGRRGDEVIGVAAYGWNGIVLVQADARPGELVVAAVRRSGRPVAGLVGPADQVAEARCAAGLGDARATLDSAELLMALALDRMVMPPALASGAVTGRLAEPGDRELLIAWRVAYFAETDPHGAGPDPPAPEAPAPGAAEREARSIDRMIAQRRLWLVEQAGAPVAMCLHNAVLPDAVQIGGVYTPPALRGRGHARAVVATSLIDARAAGAARAILFTPRPDAVAAYRAIGFAPIGHYAVVLFAL
jgi:GNAT superfamily N-acetyltransferase